MRKTIALILTLTLLVGCGKKTSSSSSDNSLKLTTYQADYSGYQFLSDQTPPFSAIKIQESIRLFDEKGTGILVYSYDTCPWCNRALPILASVAENEKATVYYVDVQEKEFLSLDTEEKNEITQQLFTKIDSTLQVNNGKKGMRVPLVIAVKDGNIVDYHIGVISDFKLDTSKLDEYQLSDQQVEEVKEIYEKMFEEIA